MKYRERRRPSSRWVRYWSKRGRLAALLIVLGWTLTAYAQAEMPHHSVTGEVIMAMLGGGVLLFGMAAGMTKWLIEPGSRKIIAEHEAKGVAAHAGYYVPVEKWEEKHDELDRRIDSIKEHVSTEMTNLRDVLLRDRPGRKGGHE